MIILLKKRFFAFLTAVFCLQWLSVCAQVKPRVEYYGTSDGLSHSMVTNIIKDQEGFMWFGTWNGISRFDGKKFVAYKSSPKDKYQLENDRIDHILDDGFGNLWLKAYDGHFYQFDKKKNSFLPLHILLRDSSIQHVRFTKSYMSRNGLVWILSEDDGVFCIDPNALSSQKKLHFSAKQKAPFHIVSNKVNFIHEDRDGDMWLGTENGLYCLKPTAGKNYRNTMPEMGRNADFVKVAEDDKQIYFVTVEGFLLEYDKGKQNFARIDLSPSKLNSVVRSKASNILYATSQNGELFAVELSGNRVVQYAPGLGPLLRMKEDKSGTLWIEPEKSGVVKFDPFSHQFQLVRTEQSSRLSGSSSPFFNVFEDINGGVWVNTKDDGFGFYDKASGIIRHVSNSDGNMPFPHFVDLAYYDKSGVFWVKSDQRGIIKITIQPNSFQQQLLAQPEYLRNENDVRAIAPARNSRIWIGTKSGDVYVMENQQTKRPVFHGISSQAFGSVYAVFEDSRSQIWIGTKTNGLFKATPISPNVLEYNVVHYGKSADESGLTSDQIYSISEDKNGNIWLGSFDGGIMKVMETAAETRFVRNRTFLKNYPKAGFDKIRYLTFDGLGDLWIATTDGLVVMDGHSNINLPDFTVYRRRAGDGQSLGDNDIQYIYQDSRKKMWVATSGGGLALAQGDNIRKLTFRNYTVDDGLSNDFVVSMVEDADGNLWIATENGLSKLDHATGKFINYNAYDGLPATVFSEGPSARDVNGNIFFGMVKGFLTFDPRNLSNNRIVGALAFTNLQINNKNAGPEIEGNTIDQDINFLPKLVLKYNQNIIRLDCALLDYRFSGKELISYRLKGFDSTWTNAPQNTQITYTNLPAGEYLLEVKTLRNDLYSNTVYRSLPIVVLPAPWKTWWAYTLYLIAAIVVIVIVSRTILTMLKLRHNIALEKKMADLKLHFFTNVSHELRTPLTLILGPLEQLAQKEQLSDEGKSYIEIAQKSAGRMSHFVNQLLDLRKIQSGSTKLHIAYIDIVSIVQKSCAHFTALAESKQIDFHIVAPPENILAYVDGEKLDMVVYNILSNAFKYTPNGKSIEVVVEMLPERGAFSVRVSDEGPGVSPEKLPRIFDLFNETNDSNNKVKGSGIGLALCRELVELHRGTIAAKNRPKGGGLEVTFVIDCQANKLLEKSVEAAPATLTETFNTPLSTELPLLPEKTNETAPLVLLVEDNPDLNNFIQKQLSAFYRVETAFDGEEGLQKALQLQPDIIVSDVMMPKMNGIELLDKLKNCVETSHIPVILLTAKSSVESQVEGLSYGADYYITKPFNNKFLMASINNLVKQRARLFARMVDKKAPELKPEKIAMTSKDEAFLQKVVKIVSDNMDDSDFNIEATAAQLNMTHNTFYKKFKSLTSSTPVEFVRDLRLQRAKEYLETGEYNVSEVAYMVGFNNPKYFSTCFKEKFNMSPSAVGKT